MKHFKTHNCVVSKITLWVDTKLSFRGIIIFPKVNGLFYLTAYVIKLYFYLRIFPLGDLEKKLCPHVLASQFTLSFQRQKVFPVSFLTILLNNKSITHVKEYTIRYEYMGCILFYFSFIYLLFIVNGYILF